MKNEELKSYVSGLDLKAPKAAYAPSGTVLKSAFKGVERGVEAPVEESFFNAKSLVSFASGVSAKNKQDVLNSTLFAQLAANKQFPEETQIIDWYKYFMTVMGNIGWIVEANEISEFNSSKDLVEIENVIIDILTTALGGNYVNIITKTLAAIKTLKAGDTTINAFEKNSHSTTKGAFQVGLAVDEGELAALTLGTFLITSSTQIKSILFFKSTKDKIHIEYCSRKATLNPEVYSHIRETINAKINALLSQYVSKIEI